MMFSAYWDRIISGHTHESQIGHLHVGHVESPSNRGFYDVRKPHDVVTLSLLLYKSTSSNL